MPHHINSAILLSPAGFHEDTSLTIKIIAWLAAKVASRFTTHIALPEGIIDLIQKLHNDLVKLPSTRDLFTNLTEFFVGGEKQISRDSPIWKSALIVSSVCKFGFSTDLCKQFQHQFSRSGFRSCNLDTPTSYLEDLVAILAGSAKQETEKQDLSEYYHLIDDVLIHLYISMNDELIKPNDVIKHYHHLAKHHPQ